MGDVDFQHQVGLGIASPPDSEEAPCPLSRRGRLSDQNLGRNSQSLAELPNHC
jgi:hypothetical protein